MDKADACKFLGLPRWLAIAAAFVLIAFVAAVGPYAYKLFVLVEAPAVQPKSPAAVALPQ